MKLCIKAQGSWFITLFALSVLLHGFMFESTLFWMILGILVLITACLLLIAYEMTKRDIGRTGLHAKKRSEALKECAFYFGFLSEQPVGKPIPDECFGCTLALSCIKTTKPHNGSQMEKQVAIA